MPDAEGRIRGIAVPADAWERIFLKNRPLTEEDCKESSRTAMRLAGALPPELEDPDEAR